MRILQLAQWYPPVIGGEELHVQHLSAELVRRGHSVSVVTVRQPGLAEQEQDLGVRVYRVSGSAQRLAPLFSNASRKSAAPVPDPEITAALRRVIATERPDLIHAHNWMAYSFLPLARVSRAKLVMTVHDFSVVCARKDYMYLGRDNCPGPGVERCLRCAAQHYGLAKGTATAIGRWVMAPFLRRSVDRFIAVSRSVAEGNRFEESGVSYVTIPNFIADAKQGAIADVEVPGLPELPFLLYVGAISRVKGVDVLLRAYSALARRPPLVLIGYPGNDTPALLANLPEGVTYLENQPHAVVLAAWRRSLAGIVPSVWRDACPTVVMEAMAAGSPVVASRIGGIPDLVRDGVSGLLVEPGSVDELHGALDRIITDRALASLLAEGARNAVTAFTASTVVPRIEAVYADALGGRAL